MKGVAKPKYHLGSDHKCEGTEGSSYMWVSHLYQESNWDVHPPFKPEDRADLDTYPLIGAHETALYMSMIGDMQWAVALGVVYFGSHYKHVWIHNCTSLGPFSKFYEVLFVSGNAIFNLSMFDHQ